MAIGIDTRFLETQRALLSGKEGLEARKIPPTFSEVCKAAATGVERINKKLDDIMTCESLQSVPMIALSTER